MTINASDVKRLREETDAPMMECKNALVEAEGDFEKAKLILREKGQAAATKRAGRSTSEGIAKFVTNDDGTVAAGIVLECETDFVAKNDMFVALADKVAKAFLDADPGSDPGSVALDGSTVAGQIENAVAVIRENIVLKKAMRLAPGKTVAVYNHHNGKVASAVVLDGPASNIRDAGFQAAIQVVAFPPHFVRKDQVPQDVVDAEYQTEVQRALNDGKTQEIAEKMATGRVHKEYIKSVVLLEQPFYLDDKQTVGQFLDQEGKVGGGPITLEEFVRLEVGQE